MPSLSSLVTTAASDESSSADSGRSPARPDRIPRPNPRGSNLSHRRSSSTGKSEIANRARQQRQKVVCGCRLCAGARMVSRSTSYRHLRIDAEIADDDAKWEARWSFTSPKL